MSNPITNHEKVRRIALDAANQRRRQMNMDPRYTRVSEAFIDQIDAEVHLLVVRRASQHWQKGKTLT